jgi:ligand-binding sensor domain-containing protein
LDDTIYDVDASSPDGTRWFTCFRGVGALHRDGTRQRWGWKEAGFPGHQVNQILRRGGATYISTHNRQGLFVLREGTWSRIPLPQTVRGLVNSIVPGPDGRIWLGTADGVLSWDPSESQQVWKHYTKSNSGLPDDAVRRMAFDRRGRLWLGTTTRSESDTGGLCVYENGRWTVYSPANSPLPERRVWSVYVDAADRVWAATSKGAACLHPDGRWSVLNVTNSGLIDNLVTDIAQDTAGDIWLGTAYGVSRLAPGRL